MFMRVFGKDEMNVNARAVIRRQTSGMELALIMDNTGSMNSGGKFDAMQAAAFDLIDILFGDEDEIENLWVSLVPYTATVNVGNWRTGWIASGDRVLTNPGDFSTAGWKGCVEARAYPRDSDDTLPSAAGFTSYFYPSTTGIPQDNEWPPLNTAQSAGNNGSGPNLGCGPEITPLTQQRSTIDAGIANMAPWSRGGTAGNLGLSWGWRTISPDWRGLWGMDTPSTHPLDYGEDYMDKVVVVLTDGQNQFYDKHKTGGAPRSDYTAYGRLEALGVTDTTAGQGILDDRMIETCTAMKAKGVRIYSITFGSSIKSSSKTLFSACATSPAMYFHAPSNSDLSAVFRAIGGELANLRIVE